MIKQLITEFPLSDVPVERSISKEKINKYAYTKRGGCIDCCCGQRGG